MWHAKYQQLRAFAAAGLPVPPMWSRDQLEHAPDAILEQLSKGTVLVRTAGLHEDGAVSSGAGLSLSVARLRTLESVRDAMAKLTAAAPDAIVFAHAEVPRLLLLAVAVEPTGSIHVDIHGPESGTTPLADGRTPQWAGPLSEWNGPAHAKVLTLVATAAALCRGAYGAELEIVIDPEHRPWLVQGRPLTRPLLHGEYHLDVEHNPAPLSPAHAWLLDRLRELRPGAAGDPRCIEGWLYSTIPPRELAPHAPGSALDPRAALELLHREFLPAARQRLEAVEERLGSAPPISIREALDLAIEAFVAAIDVYLAILVPARRGVLHPQASDRLDPYCLRDRGAYLDVLPIEWDIASPPLAGVLSGLSQRSSDARLPTDPEAATVLLGEQDDHLFALGMAPTRRVYLWAAARLGLDETEVFLLRGDELQAPATPEQRASLHLLLETREKAQLGYAAAVPPRTWVGGRKVARPHVPQVVAMGAPFEGPAAPRTGLADLLQRPPSPGSVLCIPALTAQASVVLHNLGLRAVCCQHGGSLSHAAVISRELGLSALIGIAECLDVRDGERIRLDTIDGRLIRGL